MLYLDVRCGCRKGGLLLENEYTVDDFLGLRAQNKLEGWLDGVYLIKNQTKDMYYVGQSINVKDRLFTHFTGRGNGDVYFDYRIGDSFLVRYYPFNPNQFRSIDELEYHLIRIYQSSETGYNRQQGNRVRTTVP